MVRMTRCWASKLLLASIMFTMATMDFFAHQAVARKKTGLLVALFVAAVLAILVGTYLALRPPRLTCARSIPWLRR